MPGFKNVGGPRFLGAGYGDIMPKAKAKQQKKPKPNIQSWQDRNFKNRKTKLNP